MNSKFTALTKLSPLCTMEMQGGLLMKKKRIRQVLYTEQKIARKDGRLRYIEDPDGYLYANMIYPSKMKAEDLPEWFVHGSYYRCWGYLSAKGVTDLKYVPNLWSNHFLKDDALLVSYHEMIEQISDSVILWERYKGYEIMISGNEILSFLRAAEKYSEIDIVEIVQQIQEKVDMMPIKFPNEYGDFKFNVQAYLDKEHKNIQL